MNIDDIEKQIALLMKQKEELLNEEKEAKEKEEKEEKERKEKEPTIVKI